MKGVSRGRPGSCPTQNTILSVASQLTAAQGQADHLVHGGAGRRRGTPFPRHVTQEKKKWQPGCLCLQEAHAYRPVSPLQVPSSVYRKPMHTDQYIYFKSHHLTDVNVSVMKSGPKIHFKNACKKNNKKNACQIQNELLPQCSNEDSFPGEDQAVVRHKTLHFPLCLTILVCSADDDRYNRFTTHLESTIIIVAYVPLHEILHNSVAEIA